MTNLDNVRLKPDHIKIIQDLFKIYFAAGDGLWIFGSRAYPNKKGGDIDLYVETSIQDARLLLETKLKFIVALKKELGDQKIDVVIRDPNFDLMIYDVAKTEGIKLV